MNQFPTDLRVCEEAQLSEDGRKWWDILPTLVADLEREWELTTGQPFVGGSCSWVAPARTQAGTDAVLKVNLPHREAAAEADGLAAWSGVGAARLYRSDVERMALLIERCRPGVSLNDATLDPEAVLRASADVLRKLWSAPVPDSSSFELLSDVASEWARGVRERMTTFPNSLDPGIVELGAQLLETLPRDDDARVVLLHGDFNPGNVLSAEREPWLAIDAKPMVGDAAYDPVPMIGQVEDLYGLHDSDVVIRSRHELFADLVELPAGRVLSWAVARLVEAALWYVSRGEVNEARDGAEVATRLAKLAGL